MVGEGFDLCYVLAINRFWPDLFCDYVMVFGLLYDYVNHPPVL